MKGVHSTLNKQTWFSLGFLWELKGRKVDVWLEDGFFSVHQEVRGGIQGMFWCDSISPQGIYQNRVLVLLLIEYGIFDNADQVLIRGFNKTIPLRIIISWVFQYDTIFQCKIIEF